MYSAVHPVRRHFVILSNYCSSNCYIYWGVELSTHLARVFALPKSEWSWYVSGVIQLMFIPQLVNFGPLRFYSVYFCGTHLHVFYLRSKFTGKQRLIFMFSLAIEKSVLVSLCSGFGTSACPQKSNKNGRSSISRDSVRHTGHRKSNIYLHIP